MAEQHGQAATRAYEEGRLEEMLYHAGRSFSLRHTHSSVRLLACAALLKGDYSQAINTWRTLKR